MRALAVCLLSLSLAACAIDASPDAVGTSTAAASTAPLSGLLIVPTDANMSFSFTASGAASVTITDPADNAQTQAAIANVAGVSSVLFTGLTACTQYSWSISVSGSVAQSGVVNTRYEGTNPACPTAVPVTPSQLWSFAGLEDDGSCNGWPSNSFGWAEVSTASPPATLEFGYTHTSGSCGSAVTARRAQLMYTIGSQLWARGVTGAAFTATSATSGGSCPSNGLASATTTTLGKVVWGLRSDGGEWATALAGLEGSPETTDALVQASFTTSYPIATSGNQVTINLGVPSSPNLTLGFAAPNDGYPDYAPIAGTSPTFAGDSSACMSELSNGTLTVNVGPLPPETPLCSAVVSCTSATISCRASADTFQLYASDATTKNRLVTTVNGTSGLVTPAMTDPQGSPAETYTVCTTNGVAQNCQPVPVASLTQCPIPPPVPTAVTNGCALWSSATANATVTLSAAAPAGGTLVSLGYALEAGTSNPVTGPATVRVPAGAASTTFPITVGAVSGATTVVVLSASANGTTVTSDVPVYYGNLVATITYPADATSLIVTQGIGYVGACARSGGGVATFSASNPYALLEATSATMSPSGWGAVDIVGEVVPAETDTITVTYEGSSASVVVNVGEAQGGGLNRGGGCRGTTCQ